MALLNTSYCTLRDWFRSKARPPIAEFMYELEIYLRVRGLIQLNLTLLVQSCYYALSVCIVLTYSGTLLTTIKKETIIFCHMQYSVFCGRGQGTGLRCRYERSDIPMKLAECQEQFYVL